MGVLPEKVVKKCLWATGRKDPDYESHEIRTSAPFFYHTTLPEILIFPFYHFMLH